jgi:hypothetical protein
MQIGGVLITNNSNTHPPESWAATTASMIFAVDNEIDGVKRIEAMRLQTKLADLLVEHHRRVQEEEDRMLHERDDHHASELKVDEDHLNEVVNEVMEAAKGSPWEERFNEPGMRDNVRQLIGDHFATSKNVHRMAYRQRRGMDAHLPHPGEVWQRLKAEAENEQAAREAEQR